MRSNLVKRLRYYHRYLTILPLRVVAFLVAYVLLWIVVLVNLHCIVNNKFPGAIHTHLDHLKKGLREAALAQQQEQDDTPIQNRCALCFFGLPRSYQSMVLPSIEKNVLIPNARHNCDVFVHYFHQSEEAQGRYNDGGKIDPTEIDLLKVAVNSAHRSYQSSSSPHSPVPVIKFVNDTNEAFLSKRNHELWRYHKVYDKEGDLLYFPWKKLSWDKSSLDNLVRQWHSIDSAFHLMEHHANLHNFTYTRVAMLRNDVMYMTPIDVMQLDNETLDTENKHFVLAPFANYPVNDRMIYGPYEAVKVWSTKRFDLVEERVQNSENAGYGMHSELFMNESIIPAMEELGYSKHLNPDICFVRTRANSVALIDDCIAKGETRGMRETDRQKLVEDIIGRSCGSSSFDSTDSKIVYLTC